MLFIMGIKIVDDSRMILAVIKWIIYRANSFRFLSSRHSDYVEWFRTDKGHHNSINDSTVWGEKITATLRLN